MPSIFGKEFGLSAAKTASAGILAVALAFTPAAAQEATPAPTDVALPQADVVFNYGSNIDPALVDRHVRGLARRDITAVAVQALDVDNCVALIVNGEEHFRFAAEDIRTPEMSATARLILEGHATGLTSSTCPESVNVAALTNG